ncbi:uncharacterized protein LOC113799439 [Dermatophagoides pteronyssinus]|uniref:uncharacterized protein LOC113799439 n=1 Tax=Dermatophagoides pteronyssinus TaxID=6956 RepID=UPI003F680401
MSSAKAPMTRMQGRKMASNRSQSDEIPMKFAMINVAVSLLIFVVMTFTFLKFHKSIVHPPRMISITDRLVYTLQMQTFTMIPMYLCVLNVIMNRIQTGAINPLSGHDGYIEKSVRILTNTFEQTFMNVICQLSLAVYIHSEYMYFIPYIVFCFVAGRILFLIGYTIHPKYRTFGFLLSHGITTLAFFLTLGYATGFTRMFHSSTSPGKTEL